MQIPLKSERELRLEAILRELLATSFPSQKYLIEELDCQGLSYRRFTTSKHLTRLFKAYQELDK